MKKINKILFIGNSYTFFNNSWDIFKKIALEEGFDVKVDNVTSGGYTLEKMNDPLDKYGEMVAKKLSSEEYDIVFLQEQSLRPVIDEELFYDSVRSLTEKIKCNGAITILYETWGRKTGSIDLINHNLTNEKMSKKLIASYGKIANELGLDVSHVGTVFLDLSSNHPELNLYHEDLSHPSELGSYVVALTHYSTVFKRSPIGIRYKYFLNDENSQAIIEQAIHNAILKVH